MAVTPPPSLTLPGISPDRSDRTTFTARSIARDDYIKNVQVPQLALALANVAANATDAATNTTAAASSASTAATQAATAANSAVTATTAQVTATTQAVNSSNSAYAANTSRAAIDNRTYPAPAATDPTTRPDGTANQQGDRYYNTTTKTYKAFDGAIWTDPETTAKALRDATEATGLALRNSTEAAALRARGYEPPVVYAAGIVITRTTQTVSNAGFAYAPDPASLPFTTSGTFENTKFRLIQGVSGADLAAPGGAGLVHTIAEGAGSVDRSVQDVLRDSKSIKSAGALGDGVTNDGPGVRAAATSLGAFGGELKVPIRTYRLDAANGTALTLTAPVSLRGDGGVYTAFNPDLAATTDNTIAVIPSASYDYTGMRISGLALHNPSTGQRVGNNGIYASTNVAGANLGKFTLRDMLIGQGNNPSGFGFFHFNNPTANVNGGMFCALLENSVFKGGVKLDSTGDSNSIVHSILTGNQIGLLASLVPGASLLEVQANNITANNGSIRLESGSRFRILGNNCEHYTTGSVAANNGAMINMNGGNAVMYGGVIKENLVAAFSGSDATTLVRLRNCRGTLIEDNVFLSGQSGRTGIDIGADCFDIRIGANSYNAAVTTQVVDNGSGTMGVLKTPVLQNGWVPLSAGFGTLQYIKSSDGLVHVTGSVIGGTITNGTLIASFAAGFRPTKIMKFSVFKLTAGVPGIAVCTLEPSGDFRFTYASADEMTVNFTFAADNLANSISLE